MQESISVSTNRDFDKEWLKISADYLKKYSFVENSELARKILYALSWDATYDPDWKGPVLRPDASRASELANFMKKFPSNNDAKWVDASGEETPLNDQKCYLSVWLGAPYPYIRTLLSHSNKTTPEEFKKYMLGERTGFDGVYDNLLPSSTDSNEKHEAAYSNMTKEMLKDLNDNSSLLDLKKVLINIGEALKSGIIFFGKKI